MAKKSKQPVSKGNQEMIETLNKSEAFFNKNKKAILTCLIALVLIVVGIIAYNNYADSRNEKASTAMAKCQDLFAAQDFEKALKGDSIGTPGFIQIASDYSGTKAGNLANLYAGLCYAKLDKWEEAVKYFDQFSPKSDMMVSPMSVIAMGDAYANVKQLDKAVESYKKAAKMADDASELGYNTSVSPIALQKAGIILIDQKKNDEALQLFETIKEKYLGSAAQQDVDKYIEYLKK